MDQLLHGRRDEILKVAARHGAMDVCRFGSGAWGEAGGVSDVDPGKACAWPRCAVDIDKDFILAIVRKWLKSPVNCN
jgi:hypothetical protein